MSRTTRAIPASAPRNRCRFRTSAGTLAVNLPSTATAVNAADTPGDGGSTYTAKTSLIAYDDSGSPVTLDVYMTKLANSSSGDPQWQVAVYTGATPPGGGFPRWRPAGDATSIDPTTADGRRSSLSDRRARRANDEPRQRASSTQLASAFNVNSALSNGSAPSSMTGMSVGADGTLSFLYSSGTSFPAYSIPLANVVSPDSMTSLDGTAFSANGNSGQMQMGVAGSGGLGSIQSSSLEIRPSTCDYHLHDPGAKRLLRPIRKCSRRATMEPSTS